MPHPWTNPTYHPKRHPYLFSRFATMHTHKHTNRWLAGMFDDYRPLTLYRERYGLKSVLVGIGVITYYIDSQETEKIALNRGRTDRISLTHDLNLGL